MINKLRQCLLCGKFDIPKNLFGRIVEYDVSADERGKSYGWTHINCAEKQGFFGGEEDPADWWKKK